VATLSDGTESRRAPLTVWAVLVAALQFALLVTTSSRYGYHGDEMYFIVAGGHPAFGYPDQPPLVPLLCAAMNHLAPLSLLVLRLPSALVAATTTVLAALIVREIGGERRAQVIAASCAAASAFVLATGHFVTTTTFDVLATTSVGWLLVRAVRWRSGPSLLCAGIVAGIGCQAKPQVAFVSAVAVAVLAVVGPRWPLRSPWLAAAVLGATLIAAPYLIWQGMHGWPQLTVAGNVAGSAEGGRIGFLPFQLVLVGPLLVPIWVAGLLVPWRRTELRSLRFVPLTYATVAVAYLVGDGKAYYLASLYPVLLGLGALPVAEWTRRARARLRAAVLAVAVVVSAVINGFIALPLLPPEDLQGSAVIALNPDLGNTVGWPAYIGTVADAWRSLPAETRAQTAVFTGSYAEASAVDLLGVEHGLPRSFSGHNAFSEWGPPGPDVTHVLLLGYDGPQDAAPQFTGCRRLAVLDNGVGLDNDEQGLPVMLCRPSSSWAVLWPALRHYN
jgi:4-amino-4-deoxy-L-arabinose transferase-like glycosyltransferase